MEINNYPICCGAKIISSFTYNKPTFADIKFFKKLLKNFMVKSRIRFLK